MPVLKRRSVLAALAATLIPVPMGRPEWKIEVVPMDLSKLVELSLKKHGPQIAENVSRSNALLRRINGSDARNG